MTSTKRIILILVLGIVVLLALIAIMWRPKVTQQFESTKVEFTGLFLSTYHDNRYADGPTIVRVLTTKGVVRVTVAGYRAICQGQVGSIPYKFAPVAVTGYTEGGIHDVTVCTDKNSFIKPI